MSRISHHKDGHATKVYAPAMYIKCKNGHKYILIPSSYTNMHIPYIGEVYKLRVNSDNPLSYEKEGISSSFILTIIMGATFAILPLLIYVILLFTI